MKKFCLYIFIGLLTASCNSKQGIVIYMIGDSTMSDKPNPESNPERGWGQMLPLFFDDNVTVSNHAKNGRSTRSFIGEERWDAVFKALKPGDYVFIQFGHNDQKFKDSKRYTNPHTAYRQNLVRFVKETRSKGAVPVLFSSIVRRIFNEFDVLEDTHGVYPLIVRDVSRELEVPFIDLQLKSENLVVSLGKDKSKKLYMWIPPGKYAMHPEGKQDNTHFTEYGATEMAKLAIQGLRGNRLLINHIQEEI